MLEQMKWEDVYSLWDESSYNFSKVLSAPMTAEPVFVKYNQKDTIYGFDWLQNEAAQARKALIEKDPLEFLYLQPTNKGTTQTAEMLINAQSKEELAAIWIAATAKELLRKWHWTLCAHALYGSMRISKNPVLFVASCHEKAGARNFNSTARS